MCRNAMLRKHSSSKAIWRQRVGLLLFVALLGIASSSWAIAERVILQLSASGMRHTRPSSASRAIAHFTVKDRWELRWDVKGDDFEVRLFAGARDPKGLQPLASQKGPGQGSMFYPKGGSYSLKVTANAEWTVSVVQLP